ncbi:hypothetical protein M430DRAFT_47452 [Amorphotheca resinae ATCC 22711]|uniref:Uncharacterized protein n=1 Tax=Amorphotheca resinae ATCC 22711 TaxID=857342 RepID=A0A2T3BGE6_AMORE|nr:hypothetical protein M430DRAFT_47452 [Amorphotheca resinae ATCC 22711]PSS28444.1 hypothetical protein M430DRAFT_47452 [Amorphotheca resinae ATCC 22711]
MKTSVLFLLALGLWRAAAVPDYTFLLRARQAGCDPPYCDMPYCECLDGDPACETSVCCEGC